MIRRLAIAGVAAVAVALVGAVPASAAEAPQAGSLTLAPAPESGVITTASPTVGGEWHMKEGGIVKTISVTVKPTGGQQGAQPITVKVCGGNGAPTCGNKAAVTWSKPVGPIPYNGPWEITASATGAEQFDFDGDQTGTTTPIAVKVRAPAAPPTDVKAVANEAGTEVTVSWARNAEPDVVYYVPLRQNADGSFTKNLKYVAQPAAGTARASFKDDSLGAGGQLKYYVLALRSYGETSMKDSAIPSEPSAAASVKVPVKEVPTTTTSSTAPGGGPGTTVPRTPPTVPVPTPAELRIGSLPAPIISRGGNLNKVGSSTGGEFGVNVDDGAFNENLPYGAGTKRASGGPASGGGRSSVTSMSGGDTSSPKALLIPLSAGAALCVVAFQLRFLNGRVTQPVDLV